MTRTFSAEHRANLSEAQRGLKRGPHSDATKAKISAALRGRVRTAEHKAKLSAAKLGSKASDATRAKMSAASRGVPKSAETIAKMSGKMNHNWAGADVGYGASHNRHGKVLPKVCAHVDVTCKGPIQSAFNHDTPGEYVKVDPRTSSRFSTRPEDYLRLCRSHHRRYEKREDGAHE